MERSQPTHQQDDFFYKIIQHSDKQFTIEVPATRKKYELIVDSKDEVGFRGLPFEWARLVKDMGFTPLEIEKTPMEVLMSLNFVATESLSKMYDKKTLYQKMSKICDQIMKADPYKYFKKIATIGNGGFG